MQGKLRHKDALLLRSDAKKLETEEEEEEEEEEEDIIPRA